MPTHPVGPEAQQDPIRLRNLLRQAEERLLAGGLRVPEARALLEPGHRLAEDETFWRQAGEGLALFLALEVTHVYRLPLAFEPMVYLAPRMYVRPLVPLLSGDVGFYVLALSQNAVRLFRGDGHSIAEVELAQTPESLAEALQYDLPKKQLQFRTAAPVGGGQASAVFFGTGDGADDAKDRIRRYFHQVDDGLRPALGGGGEPLVLAGVDYLLPIYREVNTYPRLMDAGITGNPELLSGQELHARARALLQPTFEQRRREAIAQYRASTSQGRAADQLRLIVPAAYHARVAALFVAQRGGRWGQFDPATGKVLLRRKQARRGDEDLLDLAAYHTLANGGEAYAVEPDEMPEAAPLAAVLRY